MLVWLPLPLQPASLAVRKRNVFRRNESLNRFTMWMWDSNFQTFAGRIPRKKEQGPESIAGPAGWPPVSLYCWDSFACRHIGLKSASTSSFFFFFIVACWNFYLSCGTHWILWCYVVWFWTIASSDVSQTFIQHSAHMSKIWSWETFLHCKTGLKGWNQQHGTLHIVPGPVDAHRLLVSSSKGERLTGGEISADPASWWSLGTVQVFLVTGPWCRSVIFLSEDTPGSGEYC